MTGKGNKRNESTGPESEAGKKTPQKGEQGSGGGKKNSGLSRDE